jgi:hypothetical protein
MDCTTYVNVMLAVYQTGDTTGVYDALCMGFGGTGGHLARDRYGFPLVERDVFDAKSKTKKKLNYFQTAEEIQAAVNERGDTSLYVLELGNPKKQGAVQHMALLYRSEVYECTTRQENGSNCLTTPLDKYVQNQKGFIFYLFHNP